MALGMETSTVTWIAGHLKQKYVRKYEAGCHGTGASGSILIALTINVGK